MEINSISSVSAIPASQDVKINEAEARKAAEDFAAVFFETMFSTMMSANIEQKGIQEEVWWDLLSERIAKEVAVSPNLLTEKILSTIKKEQ